MSTKTKHPAAAQKEPVPQHHDDASASESEDTDTAIESEAPVDDATDDSTTSLGDDDVEHDAGEGHNEVPAASIVKPTPSNATTGVPNFKKARARKPSPPKKAKKADDAPALVSGKRRAAAMAHEIIHATSATGQAEARVASAQARAIAEKKKARKRTASKPAGDQEPPAKKARKSTSETTAAASKKKTKAAASKKKAAVADGKTAKATTTKRAAAGTKRKASAESTKTAGAPKKKAKSSSGASSSSSLSAKAATKPKAAPKKKKVSTTTPKTPVVKKLGLKDAHTKYRARLAVMPAADFAVLDGAWLSVFDPQLRKRASFPEGAFSPKWTQVLAEVAREKGAVIKGVLPHYATTIEGSANLKAYEKMAHIVDKGRAADYAAAGFDQVEAARVYVGPTVLAAGVAESPFAFLHSDSIDDAFWQSVKKVLDADSSNEDPVEDGTVVEHGAETAEVDVMA
ncbi:Flagellar biosynthetic protein-like domain-containing protein [Pandoravirus kuranda]|uniref:Flagellar biosynthetic protein-like domain-containing protein n=1 Tax=Pandoravirus kuranda TaxID=3019033 RepID=A0AA95EDN2_9VIRU|nr:Flagellar biosynthetic protein-like domain-containing protein [Pandoravirus kuranda]